MGGWQIVGWFFVVVVVVVVVVVSLHWMVVQLVQAMQVRCCWGWVAAVDRGRHCGHPMMQQRATGASYWFDTHSVVASTSLLYCTMMGALHCSLLGGCQRCVMVIDGFTAIWVVFHVPNDRGLYVLGNSM